ncbi:uncharacterized protein LOC122300141 [Carya illinoinensis]|uniref:uncharacterized protein LOC122300141 n=1 Tax=Carya illinoinensis TaxID=32201 RepID=UPI001C71FF1E|nr:uncharacterized protein LOC122300141 [Carya illinoinensis]XP_042966522.1 uncharacterized protein LOC122300141 [Carya illinoinensis]
MLVHTMVTRIGTSLVFFYEALVPKMRQFVETMCNGEFFNKESEEAFAYFDYLAKNAQSWDTSCVYDRAEPLRTVSGGGVKYVLNEEDDLKAKFALLSKKLEAIELKKVHEIQGIPKQEKCTICEDISHVTSECPTIPAFKKVLCDASHPVNMISKPFPAPYSNTYNTVWRNHPNFSWKNEQPGPSTQGQSQYTPYGAAGQGSGPSYFANQLPPMQKKGVEDSIQQLTATLQQFMQSQAIVNSQNAQAINDIRGTLTIVTITLSNQEKGKFPAQTQPNPQVQSQSSQNNVEGANVKLVKVITTLRNGKVVDIPVHSARKSGKEANPPLDSGEPSTSDSNNDACLIPAPFPHHLLSLHKEKQHAEILEIFKQVRINIPLLDAIKQIPAYAKFLKDLCTVKRKLNMQKKAFLTEQVSAIIQNHTPPKYKDPGSPTISCVIGNSKIGKALLDLGSGVNLLPYSVYEQLGLGELKAKIPKGIVEDVLVQVDKFYYPVDFVVLDMKLSSHSNSSPPVILGRPFLATSNAIINCRSGVLKLSFGNMTLELNIFNLCRQPQ